MRLLAHMLQRQVLLQNFTIDRQLIFSEIKTLLFLFKNVAYALGLKVFPELVAHPRLVELGLALIVLVLHMLKGGLEGVGAARHAAVLLDL
jgi:hypothetical protein